MQKAIKHTWFFTQSPQEVWQYLTKPELIEQWLMKSNFEPVVGHKFQFTFEPKGDNKYRGNIDCEVLVVKPFTNLSYSWNGGTQDGVENFNSVVEWTLTPKENGTELQLKHDGFTLLQHLLDHDKGWPSLVKKMGELLNNQ